jgi:hypothetical protein
MPLTFWQSTSRPDRTLEHSRIGRRAYLLCAGNVAEVARRYHRGRSLAASIRQFNDDEIDAEDLRDDIDRADVNPSRVNGALGSIIAAHFHVCDDCGSLELQADALVVDDRALCEFCRENYYTCECCDSLTHGDDINCIEDSAVCDDCRDRRYYYWESDGEYHSEPEPADGPIQEYNVTLTGPIGTLPSDRRTTHVLGAELELEVGDTYYFADAIDSEHSPNDCHCKRDGSLDDEHGVEVVTGYGTLPNVLGVLESVAIIAKNHSGKSHDGDSCGLHIGLDRSQFPALLQAKIIVFWNSEGNFSFLRQFTRRDYRTNSYCRLKSDKATRVFIEDPDLASGDKYEIVNTRHHSHLEFRAFRGSLLPLTLRACLSLVSLIASFCDQADPEPTELTSGAFVRWLQASAADERMMALEAYLSNRGKSMAAYAS